jgi:hypothetical protein
MTPTPSPKSAPSPDPLSELRTEIRRSVLSRSKYPNKSSLDRIANSLRLIHATGKLTINFSQGGVNSVTFEASHDLNGSDRMELQFTDI